MSTDRPIKRRLRRLLERESETSEAGPTTKEHQEAQDEKQKRLDNLRAEIERVSRRGAGSGIAPPEPEDWASDSTPWTEPPVPLPGEPVKNPKGEAWVREKRYPAGSVQGTASIDRGRDLTGEAASLIALDESIGHFDVTRTTFLDIETTGLSMGTGTIAFLVGLGWYEDQEFIVRQIFVDRLENEPAVLLCLIEDIDLRPFLVTFNGKTFDVPVLRARLALNRMSPDIDREGHLDLLHAARRLYKRRIGDCSLDSCERSVLGFHREGDIPGELIPEIFVEYLRSGRPGRMHDIFHHNLLDVVSMAALAGRMIDLIAREPHEDMDDLVSLARVRLRHGEQEEAVHIFNHTTSSTSAEHRIESNLELAILARRRSEHELQLKLLTQVLDDDPDHSIAHLMLAKLYEHHLKLYAKALEHARNTEEVEGYEASAHRIARIERRMSNEEESDG